MGASLYGSFTQWELHTSHTFSNFSAKKMVDCLAEDFCQDSSGSLVTPLVPLNAALSDFMAIENCGQPIPTIDNHNACDFTLVGLVSDACFPPSLYSGTNRRLKIPGFGEGVGGSAPQHGTGMAPILPDDFSSFYSTVDQVDAIVGGGSFDYSNFMDYYSYGSGATDMPEYSADYSTPYTGSGDYSDYDYSSQQDDDDDFPPPSCITSTCDTQLSAFQSDPNAQLPEANSMADAVAAGSGMCGTLDPLVDCMVDNCGETDLDLIQMNTGLLAGRDCFCSSDDHTDNFACDAFFGNGDDKKYEPVAEGTCPYRCYNAIMKADTLCDIGDEIEAPGNETFVFNPFEFNEEFEDIGCAFPTPAAVVATVEGSFSLDIVVPSEPEALNVLVGILAASIESAAGAGIAIITKIGTHEFGDHSGHDHRRSLWEGLGAIAGESRGLADTVIEYNLMITTVCSGECSQADTDAAVADLTAAVQTFETVAQTPQFVTIMEEKAVEEAFYTGITLTMPTAPATGVTSSAIEYETKEPYTPPAPAPPTAEDELGGSASAMKLGMSAVLAAAVAFIAVQ